MSELLTIDHLNISFATQSGEVAAVRDVSFAITESGTLGLVGESGSGKSATSLAIMRVLPPQPPGAKWVLITHTATHVCDFLENGWAIRHSAHEDSRDPR